MKYRCDHCCELYEEEDLINGRCPSCEGEVYEVTEEELRSQRAEKALAEIEKYQDTIHDSEWYGCDIIYKSMQDRDFFQTMADIYDVEAEWGTPEETKLIDKMIESRMYLCNVYFKEKNVDLMVREAEELKGMITALKIYSAVDKGE